MNTTPRLKLPLILQSQSQKEVTHNEALSVLDVLIQAVAQDIVNIPPASPLVGECYIVGSAPQDVWIGKANKIAQGITGGGWLFVDPFRALRIWVESKDAYYFYDGAMWVPEGLLMKDSGEYLRVEQREENLTLTGITTASTIKIPNRSFVIAVNVRVTQAITGVTSFKVGVSADLARYGNNIGVAMDSTNIGMSAYPTAYYADTPIFISTTSGIFSGGKVTLTIQYLKPRGPWQW